MTNEDVTNRCMLAAELTRNFLDQAYLMWKVSDRTPPSDPPAEIIAQLINAQSHAFDNLSRDAEWERRAAERRGDV